MEFKTSTRRDVLTAAATAFTTSLFTGNVKGANDRIAVGYIRDGAKAATTLILGEDPAMEVVAIESTGAASTREQQAFRDAWLRSRRK